MVVAWPKSWGPFQPAAEALRGYSLNKARRDAVAGLTVAVLAIPQSMAYAIIAGVPPQYGLYSVIIQCLVGSLVNSQPMLSVGPINTQSLLVASTVTLAMRQATGLSPQQADALWLQMVFALTILKGAIQLGLWALRLGTLIRYVSLSVIIGFTAGAGLLIAAGQVPAFLGFRVDAHVEVLPGLIGTVQRMWPRLNEADPRSVLLGVMAVAIVVGSRRISALVPGPLLAVGLTAAIVAAVGWDTVLRVSHLPQELPGFHVPVAGARYWDSLLGGAMALGLLGLMEAYSIGTAIGAKTGHRVNANQELFGQGLANFASGFFQCIAGSGSFTRSALNHYAGAATAVSGIFNAGFVAAIVLLLAPWAHYVPMAALAGILFVIAWQLIDWHYLRRSLRASPPDAAVCLVTFAATLLLPLSYAVFIGVFLNLALYVRQTSRLHVAEMLQPPGGPFIECPLHDRAGEKPVVFLQVEGELFFGLADELQDRLAQLFNSPARVVVFRLKRTHSIDTTVLHVLERFVRQMQSRNRHVVLCGLRPELMRVVKAYGLLDLLGRENVFKTGGGVFASAKQALARARELVGRSIDTESLDVELEKEAVTYEI